jgi:uncharacterized membrane protein YhaH (DUF805 family)
MQQRQQQECSPSLRQRVTRVIDQWETSLTFFCLVFGFFIGWVLVIQPFHHLLPPDSPYLSFGTVGMVVVGAAYILATTYSALYPERHGAYAAISLIAGTGLYAGLRAHDIVATGFWTLALITVSVGVARLLRALYRGARQ